MLHRQSLSIVSERPFDLRELFFSTTDKRGVIRYGNDVFTRVSGYEQAELFGFAHSKVRHADMPASVFQLFWDTLGRGESIAAYVKNQAKGGEYYWVMAMASPIPDGYLSIRLKPTCGLLSEVERIYREVKDAELDAKAEGLDKQAAISCGLALLLRELQKLGFDNYESFMKHALPAEMCSRQRLIAQESNIPNRNNTFARHTDSNTATENAKSTSTLATMLTHLNGLQHSNNRFLEQCKAMLRVSDEISRVALNAKIAADTEVCEAISGLLATAESDNRKTIARMDTAVHEVMAELDELAFDVALAALQTEVASLFLEEIESSERDQVELKRNMFDVLFVLARKTIDRLLERLKFADQWFRSLYRIVKNLNYSAKSLRYIRTAAVTESAQLPASHAFSGLFDEVKLHIKQTFEITEEMQSSLSAAEVALQKIVALTPQISYGGPMKMTV